MLDKKGVCLEENFPAIRLFKLGIQIMTIQVA